MFRRTRSEDTVQVRCPISICLLYIVRFSICLGGGLDGRSKHVATKRSSYLHLSPGRRLLRDLRYPISVCICYTASFCVCLGGGSDNSGDQAATV
jgi:hypothetical protein